MLANIRNFIFTYDYVRVLFRFIILKTLNILFIGPLRYTTMKPDLLLVQPLNCSKPVSAVKVT